MENQQQVYCKPKAIHKYLKIIEIEENDGLAYSVSSLLNKEFAYLNVGSSKQFKHKITEFPSH